MFPRIILQPGSLLNFDIRSKNSLQMQIVEFQIFLEIKAESLHNPTHPFVQRMGAIFIKK